MRLTAGNTRNKLNLVRSVSILCIGNGAGMSCDRRRGFETTISERTSTRQASTMSAAQRFQEVRQTFSGEGHGLREQFAADQCRARESVLSADEVDAGSPCLVP